MRRAFTLAEIMIVLAVIGILSAILLPTAFHSVPDENLLKFKKANSTLGTVIRELVNSDRYYTEGHLGTKFDGTVVDSETYFCETFADMITTKSVNCSSASGSGDFLTTLSGSNDRSDSETGDVTVIKDDLDKVCLEAQTSVGTEIVSADNIHWFQASPKTHFGLLVELPEVDGVKPQPAYRFASPDKVPYFHDKNGFDVVYKVFCFDVDGIKTNKEGADISEPPFGYGIRGDGRIVPGTRADTWIKESIQKKGD